MSVAKSKPVPFRTARSILRKLGYTLTHKGGSLYLEPQRENHAAAYWPESPQAALDYVVRLSTR